MRNPLEFWLVPTRIRLLKMLCLYAALIVAQATAPAKIADGKVTYTGKADSVVRVLQEFSRGTGLEVSAAPGLADEIVLVRVKDLPVQEFYDRLATTVNGEWVKDNSNKLFLRPKAAPRPGLNALFGDRLRKYLKKRQEVNKEPLTEEKMEENLRQINKLENADEDGADPDGNRWMKAMQLREQAPMNRAAVEIFATLDLDRISMMKPGDRLVYSFRPKPLQLPLPAAAANIFRDLQQRAARFEEIEQRLMREFHPEWFEHEQENPAPSEPAGEEVVAAPKISFDQSLFIVERSNEVYEDGAVTLRLLSAYDTVPGPDEETSSYTNSIETQIGGWMDSQEEMAELWNPGAADPAAAKIPLRPETEEFKKEWATILSGKAEKYSEVHLRPDLYEPLGFAASDLLTAWLDAKNLQTVTALPDTLAFLGLYGEYPPPTVGGVDSFLKAISAMIPIENQAGWFSFSPQALSMAGRTNRVALARFITAFRESGQLQIDPLADLFATSQTGQYGMGLLMMYLQGGAGASLNSLSVPALKFFGTLTTTQRGVLKSGGKIPYAQLTKPQREAFAGLVYGASPKIRRAPGPEDFGDRSESDFHDYGGEVGVDSEPTNLWSKGIPEGAFVTGKNKSFIMMFAYPSTPQEFDWSYPQSPADIGQNIYFVENPDKFGWVRDQPRRDRYRYATATNLELEIPMNDKFFVRVRLQEVGPKSGKAVELKDLPQELRTQVQAGYEKAKEDYKDYIPGSGGGGGPKPKP